MATYQELRARSQQVRDEQNIGGNTALRVGQLLMDIVKYFNDNDEAASEYLQQHFAMVNDGTQLLNWQQSPIVILHTMGETYDDGDWSALSQGENFFSNGFIMEADGQGGGINGETPKANVLYVNLANDTLYTWNGSSFDAITTGGGGGISGDDIIKNAYYSNGNLVLIIETESGDKTVTIPVNFDASNYVPTSRTVNSKALSSNITLSQSDIPGLVAALAAKVGYSDDEWLQVKADAMQAATAVPNTTTVNGKQLSNNIVIGMADIPGLLQAIANAGSGAVSVTTNQDGTFVIHVGETDYTINLNHTHEGMAKLVKCTEATLPQTLEDDTIYVQVDNLTTPSEIEALHIFGLEFTGGGGAAPGVPYLSSPSANISMGDSENGSVTNAIRVKGRFLTQALSATLTGTGYAFGTTQPTGVTRNSDTSLTITADAAKAGVDISVVYTGTAFNATGTLVITSSSPDNIDTESTLLANELDTDGLIAHWDASDAPSSGAWVDRINSMKLNLGGTAAQTSDGYRLNNLSAPKNAWLYCDSSHISLLNSEIDKEFTCIIDCEVKFTAASKKAMIIDFGGFGTTTGGLAVNAKVNQEGTLVCGAKKGNTAITAQANDVQIPAFTLDTYIPIRMTCGIRVASNDTQVIYSKIGTAEAYSYNTPAIQVNLQGADLNYPFGAGIVYMTGNGLNYAADYLADVIYKSIIIYNKKV